MFRGREMTHTELGLKLLERLASDMTEHATIEALPKVDGRNMVMVLAPLKERTRSESTRDVAVDLLDDVTEAVADDSVESA